jgi:RimJ/RimL family protein N-acetyltransferase
MNKMLLEIPTRIQTERLILRCYEAGDGAWYYSAGQKNRAHLEQFESDNAILSAHTEEEAEVIIREMAAAWVARNCFFLGAFEKQTAQFVGQVYIGPVNWELPEFEIGYIADVDHEGKGYVTEAVKAVLRVLFEDLGAHRVRIQCGDTNLRSHRVAERCGFTLEGHIRETKRASDGTYSGDLFYGMLKDEYEAGYNPG